MKGFCLLFVVTLIGMVEGRTIRVMTYNVALSQTQEGQLAALLRTGDFAAAKRVAEVVQILAPDVLLVNEFDYDANGTAASRMNERYFKVSQNGRTPQDFPYRYVGLTNTGVHSGVDLDNADGVVSTPGSREYGNDAFGYGEFPGKFAMAVFSKFPIDFEGIRSFEEFLWKEMPGNLIPPGYLSEAALEVFRLSSKNHWDVPIEVMGTKFHFLVSHPTPPVFDGPEDRNGRRNHDEIRLWADYLRPAEAGYLGGGLPEGRRFVVAGDQNADPERGDSVEAAINQLLEHPRIDSTFVPKRTGAVTAANQFDTATFRLRVDYVLPSRLGFFTEGGAVFWPTSGQDGASLVTVSDHRPVYLDLKLVPLINEAVRDLKLRRVSDGSELSWEVAAEVSYRVEKSRDPESDDWQEDAGLGLEIESGRARVTVPFSAEREFFRVAAFYE